MILRIKQFFEKYMQVADTHDDLDRRLKLASAALLVEMMHVDLEVNDQEETRLREILHSGFHLERDESDAVIELAHEKQRGATDYFQFTSLINEHYTQQQKIRLVEQLWQLAWADERIDAYEEHLVRKLAELLHVPHHQFIKAKHRVLGTTE